MQLSAQLQRLAFVQEWGDGVIKHLLKVADELSLTEEGRASLAQQVAQDVNLVALRAGDEGTLVTAAKLLKLPDVASLKKLFADNPPLSVAMQARPARAKSGKVVAISMTEVVFESNSLLDGGNRLFAFEKLRGGMDVQVNDFVAVNRFGHRLVPDSLSGRSDEASLHSAR